MTIKFILIRKYLFQNAVANRKSTTLAEARKLYDEAHRQALNGIMPSMRF